MRPVLSSFQNETKTLQGKKATDQYPLWKQTQKSSMKSRKLNMAIYEKRTIHHDLTQNARLVQQIKINQCNAQY